MNEDKCCVFASRGLFALSDGASESFHSASWARILVRQFTQIPDVDVGWVDRATAAYHLQFDRDSMSWSAQAAYDRGSFATLIGIVVSPPGRCARIVGIGDSLAVLADGERFEASFPYTSPLEFSQNPLLLSTNAAGNRFVAADDFSRRFQTTWDLHHLTQPTILCMTDALGMWLLTEPGARLGALMKMRSRIQFGALVQRERQAGRLRRDDTTLLIIR